MSRLRTGGQEVSLGTLCGLFGYSRQSYYKRPSNDFAQGAMEPLIVEKVSEYRAKNPGLGCAKLYVIVKTLFDNCDHMPGRDAFIEILRRNGLMVRMKRRRHYKTTDSAHHYHKWPNLTAGFRPDAPNQLWVSDITYVETDEGVCYLSLITDAYSHKVVGWSLGPTLEAAYPIAALRGALSTIDDETAAGLIHHSDRGCQYCCHDYVEALQERKVRISMTQSGDPLENAVAERVNGILKTEWIYKMTIPTRADCHRQMERIIDFYNNERPHMSIGMQTPAVAHTQTGEQKVCWKNYYP